jgi:hypothetical protein
MTTQIVCHIPQGLTGLPLGLGGTLINITPPPRHDRRNTTPYAILVTVDPVAWANFVNNPAYQSLLTPQALSKHAVLVPCN